MISVQVSLPDSLFAAMRKAPHEVPRELRIAARSASAGRSPITPREVAKKAEVAA